MNIFNTLSSAFRKKPQIPVGNTSGNVGSVINQVSKLNLKPQQPKKPVYQSLNTNKVANSSATLNSAYNQNSKAQPIKPPQKLPSHTYGNQQPTKFAQQTQSPSDPNLTYFDRIKNSYDESLRRREQLAEQNRQANVQSAREMYDSAIASAKNEIPSIQEGLDRYTNMARQGISNEEQNANAMKTNEENDWGKNQRLLAQAKRQTSGGRERQYAALGTIDSYGTGSFTEANQKDDQAFLEQTNDNLQQKQSRISQIDFSLNKAKQDVESKILEKAAETQNRIREINSSITDNEQMKGQALRQAYLQFQQEVTGIKDEFEGLKMDAEGQKMNYMQELQKNQGESDYVNNLSQDFLTSGKPKTMNDIMYITKNPQGAKTLMDSFKSSAGSEQARASAKDSNIARQGVSEIDSIYNNIGARRDLNPFSNQQYKSSISNITDLIGRMRSGGAITIDEEKRFKTLLPTFIDNDQTAKAKLDKLKREFAGLGSSSSLQTSMQSNNINDPLGLGF